MRKPICAILILSMILCLCACSPVTPVQPDVPVENSPDVPNEPHLTPDPFVIEEDSVIVNMKREDKTFNDPENEENVIFTYGCTTPVAEITGNFQASEKINEFFALLEEEFATGNDYGNGGGIGLDHVLELAIDAYDYAMQNNGSIPTYSMDRQADVKRADSKIFSITVTDTVYTGGARASTVQKAYTFDVKTGEILTLQDIVSDKDSFIDSSREHIKYLTEGISGVEASAVDALDLENCWYLDSDSLVFYANPYTLSPSAAGVLKFDTDYSALEGMIDEAYLPYDRHEDICDVSLVSELADGTAAILDKLTVDDEGSDFAFLCSGSVYNVRVSVVGYAEHSNTYYPTRLLWYCSRIKDAAVQIRAAIPDVIPNLMLTYCSADGTEHRYLVSQSGQDGSLLLINAEDIEGLNYTSYIGKWNVSDMDDAPELVLIISEADSDHISFTMTAQNYPEYTATNVSLSSDRASFTTDDGSMRGLLELYSGYVTLTVLESDDNSIFAPYSVYDFIIE